MSDFKKHIKNLTQQEVMQLEASKNSGSICIREWIEDSWEVVQPMLAEYGEVAKAEIAAMRAGENPIESDQAFMMFSIFMTKILLSKKLTRSLISIAMAGIASEMLAVKGCMDLEEELGE